MRFLSAIVLQGVVLVFIGVAGLWPVDVWAAPPATVFGTDFTRANWDLVMRWLNFIILAGLIIKYARTPVIHFLKGRKAETVRTIQQVEDKKRLAEEKIREGRIQLQASEERLALIQDRIVVEGKRRREQMISDAKNESRIMLTAAKTRIDSQIREAHDTIRCELIDAAYEKAMTKLPQVVTDADHERMVSLWQKEVAKL